MWFLPNVDHPHTTVKSKTVSQKHGKLGAVYTVSIITVAVAVVFVMIPVVSQVRSSEPILPEMGSGKV